MKRAWRRGCSPWGVITHIVCGLHARRRVSVSSVPDRFWHRLSRPRPKNPQTEIFTGLEASNNAMSGYLGAGYAFGKWTLRVWLAGPRGRRAWALRLPRNSVRRRRRSELRRCAYRLPVPHPSPVSKIARRHRSRRSEHHAARSGEFGARQRRRSQARSRKLAGPFADVVPLRRCQY